MKGPRPCNEGMSPSGGAHLAAPSRPVAGDGVPLSMFGESSVLVTVFPEPPSRCNAAVDQDNQSTWSGANVGQHVNKSKTPLP